MAIALSDQWEECIGSVVRDFNADRLDQRHLLPRQEAQRLIAVVRVGLRGYLETTVSRCNQVRTLLYRDSGADLDELYVKTTFESHCEVFLEDQFVAHLRRSRRAIVSGNAGSGKSIFMKHVALEGMKSVEPVLPLFVEMRNINHTNSSILQYIKDNILGAHFDGLDESGMDIILKSGVFRLVLDGFDETHFERRDVYRRELDYLCRRYSKTEIVLSTRPEEETLSLADFDVFHVLPLAAKVAADLISKIKYDPDVKSAFLRALPSIYDQHSELASSPLLLTMLLLTYDQVGEVPQKMHIFYNQAFETLVLKHDRLKAHYARITRSALDLESIKRTYAHFCAVSHARNEISFTEARILQLLKDSIQFARVEVSEGDFLLDLLFSFSMLKRDGLFVTFVHRSFQEYFCAVFVSRLEGENFRRAFDSLLARGPSDQCVNMLCDLAPERVMHAWMRPLLEPLLARLLQLEKDRAVGFFAKELYGAIQLDQSGVLRAHPRSPLLGNLVLCGRLIGLGEAGGNMLMKQGGEVAEKRVQDFFGYRAPFDHCIVEPQSEDDAWLRDSWIEAQLSSVRRFVEEALAEISAIRDTQTAGSRIDFEYLHADDRRSGFVGFDIQGRPKVVEDQRTGKKKSIRQAATTHRRVFDSSQ